MSRHDNRGAGTGMVVCVALLAAAGWIGWNIGGAYVRDVQADINAARNPVVPSAPIVVTAAAVDPYGLTINDCEQEGALLPCVQEVTPRAWVLRWDANRTDPLLGCEAEDGGPVLPCVWRNPDMGSGEWLVYTDHLELGGK